MTPAVRVKTEKIVRDLLAKLLRDRSIEPEIVRAEIIPQFASLLGAAAVDNITQSDIWLEEVQAKAEEYFKVYSELNK